MFDRRFYVNISLSLVIIINSLIISRCYVSIDGRETSVLVSLSLSNIYVIFIFYLYIVSTIEIIILKSYFTGKYRRIYNTCVSKLLILLTSYNENFLCSLRNEEPFLFSSLSTEVYFRHRHATQESNE